MTSVVVRSEQQPEPTKEDVVAALERFLRSARMVRSPKLCKLVTYLVEETLAGRGSDISAYAIGFAAFGRAAGFDPTGDPIVRVEILRLRKALKDYYEADGQAEPLRIRLPLRKYVPEFGFHLASTPGKGRSDAMPTVRVILEAPEAQAAEQADVAHAFGRALLDAIPRFAFIRLLHESEPDAAAADFVLTLSFWFNRRDGRMTYRYDVRERESGTTIRHAGGELDAETIETDVSQVASAVFSNSGCIHRHNFAAMLSGRRFGSRYSVVLRYLDVVRGFDISDEETRVQDDLEALVRADPGFGLAHTCLAHLVYRRSVGLLDDAVRHEAIARAEKLARQGTRLSPQSSFAFATLFWLSYIDGEFRIADAAFQTAIALNPYNSGVRLQRGARLISGGSPLEGLSVLRRLLLNELNYPTEYLVYGAIGSYLVGDTTGLAEYGLQVPVDYRLTTQAHPLGFMVRGLVAFSRNEPPLAKRCVSSMEVCLGLTFADLPKYLASFIQDEPSRMAIVAGLSGARAVETDNVADHNTPRQGQRN